MKRIVLSVLSLFTLAAAVKAQSTTSPMSSPGSSVIIKGGVNFANISNKDDGGYDDSRMLTTWQAGIVGDFNITEFLAIQPGIFYSSKGVKLQNGDPGDLDYVKTTFNPQYIEVPVNLVFKTPTGAAKLFFGAGPYVAMGVGGKFKTDTELFGSSESDIEFNDDDPLTEEQEDAGVFRVRRFDFGLNGLAGFEAGAFVFTANYGLGLAKIASTGDNSEDRNNKHRVFSLTVGFKFF